MAKKYKIKKENLTEFFTWFTKKNVPPKIEDLINDGVWNWSKPHHLLGWSLAKEFRYYVDKVPNIRSCDTSNPVVAGIKGIRYNGDLGLQDKPSQKLADLIEHKVDDKEIIDIVYNAYMFKKIINR